MGLSKEIGLHKEESVLMYGPCFYCLAHHSHIRLIFAMHEMPCSKPFYGCGHSTWPMITIDLFYIFTVAIILLTAVGTN